MQTQDTSNLFQSDAQHAKALYRSAKAKLYSEAGNLIQLGSKPLRVVIKQLPGKEADAWCAESGFVIRRVGLDSGKTKQIYRGHLGPVTSLDFFTTPAIPAQPDKAATSARTFLISGSWDNSFRVWDTRTKDLLSTTLAHTDFVKALIVIPSLEILVTGSSDKDLRIWDLRPLTTGNSYDSDVIASEVIDQELEEPQIPTTPDFYDIPIPTGAAPPAPKALLPLPLLLSLKSHTRPIERLSFYHVMSEDKDVSDVTGRIVLLSADSMGVLKSWEIWRDEEGILRGELRSDTRPHLIGIYDLIVGEGEIWTASADNSVLLSTFSPTNPLLAPQPTLRIPHPASIKSILSLPISLSSLNSNYLLTGSIDESIRIFDLDEYDTTSTLGGGGGMVQGKPWLGIAADEASKLPGMVKEVEGHSHDVTDLGVYVKYVVIESVELDKGKDTTKKNEAWILSASVDGTLRRWKWPNMLMEEVKVLADKPDKVKETSDMTEEEEKELEELMEGLGEDD